MWLILLVVLLFLCFGGGFYGHYSGGPAYYGYGGFGLGTILLIVVIIILVTGIR